MIRKWPLASCLSACLVLMACPSGPSSSTPDRAQGQEEAAALQGKIGFINGLVSQRHLAARLLDDLTTALPDRVRLTEVVYNSDGVQIKGIAPSNNLLADYVSRLEGNPDLTSVILLSSVQRRGRNNEYQEFALKARVNDLREEKPSMRLEELEKILPSRQETGDMLRQLQMLASDSGLQMTKFTPGNEISGEFYNEWPISIEVTGSREDIGRFLAGMADLRCLWIVKKFSFKAVSDQDARSPIRVSITALTYFPREIPDAAARRR